MIQCFSRKEYLKPGVLGLVDDNIFGEHRDLKGRIRHKCGVWILEQAC